MKPIQKLLLGLSALAFLAIIVASLTWSEAAFDLFVMGPILLIAAIAAVIDQMQTDRLNR